MGWLSGYTYRMDVPAANPSGSGNRTLTVPFPGWFLRAHPSGAKVALSSYNDVHVTTADGTSELPVTINAAKNSLTVDYASMPAGHTTLYVYYGNASASAPSAATSGYSSTVQCCNANGEVTSEGDTSPVDYIWGTDIDATQISSGATSTYYGGSTSHSLGITSAGVKAHYLIKPGAWTLRKGTTSTATLHLYNESSTGNVGAGTIYCHRFKNTGTDSATAGTRHDQWVRTGWTCDDTNSKPTWNTRFTSIYNGSVAWQTAGATNSNEIDSTEHVDLSIAAGESTGYKSISLTASWIDAWQGDSYANGLLLKDSTDSAGASNRYLTITAPSQTNSPVFEITYSAVDNDQFTSRKITTDTYFASTFAVQNRYLLEPTDSMAILGCINVEKKWDFFYISPAGRVRRMIQNSCPSSTAFDDTSPGAGLHFDVSTGRIWVGGNWDTTATLAIGYTSPYVLDSITWNTSSGVTSTYKWSLIARNDVAYCVFPTSNQGAGTGTRATDKLHYKTFTRSTATWGSSTELLNCSVTGESTIVATTTLMTDTFTDSDNTLLTAHTSDSSTTWTEHPSSANSTGKIVSNKLVSKDANPSTYYSSYTPGSADYAVQVDATYHTANGHTFYLGGRLNTAQNNQYRVYYSGGDWNLQVLWNNAANFSNLGTYTQTLTAGQTYTVKLHMVGTAIKVYINGTLRISATDSNVTATGRPGLALTGASSSSSTGWELDNYKVLDTATSISSGATTIPLASATSYPSSGSVMIDTEFIWYTGKSGNSLTGCIRGMFNSTAASHADGAAVYIDQCQPAYDAVSYDATNDVMRVMCSINSLANVSGYTDPPGAPFSGSYSYIKVVALNYDFAQSRWEDGAGNALTLPLTNSTWETISRSNLPAYGNNLLARSDGTALASFNEYSDHLNPTDTRVAKLSGGSWSTVDVTDNLLEASLADYGSTDIRMTGLGTVNSSGAQAVKVIASNDSGSTWGSATTISTHTHAAPSTNTNWANNMLWCSDVADAPNLISGSRAIALTYYQHFTYHGALYVTIGVAAQAKTYTADAVLTAATTTPTTSYTADAILKATSTKTVTADAVLVAQTSTKTYTVDAVLTSLATSTDESLVLSGTELNDLTIFALAHPDGLDLTPPQKRVEWVDATDADGSALLRDPYWENRVITLKLRIRQQASKTAALNRIGQIVDLLEEAERNIDGIPLVWTPRGSSNSMTFYVLSGEVSEFPTDWSGYMQNAPIITVRMTCKPHGYGEEVVVGPTSSSAPILTHLVAGVAGDAPAEGRLIITDTASQSRRHVEWGVRSRWYDAAAGLLVDSASLTDPGAQTTSTTRTGAYSSSGVLRTTLTTRSVVCCGTGNLGHVGTLRVKARVYASANGTTARLTWQEGDGPMRSNDWVTIPFAGTFAEIDLGTITVPEATLGTQRWSGNIEAYSAAAGDTLDVDYIVLIPTAEGYGKARATYPNATPTTINARDEFTSTSSGSDLSGTTADDGSSTWATSGATTDFKFADAPDSGETITRTTTGDTGAGRFALLGSTSYTDTEIGVRFYFSSKVGQQHSLIARYVDSSNYLYGTVTPNVSLLNLFIATSPSAGGASTFQVSTPPLSVNTWYRLRMVAYAGGSVTLWLMDDAGSILSQVTGSWSALATGGVLASGKPGISDFNDSGQACTRYYDNFYEATPASEPIVIYSGRSAEISYGSALRADSAGTYYGPVPSHRPAPQFLLPPAGSQGRTSEVSVKARRNDVDIAADDQIADALSVSVKYTPRYIVVPR